MRVLYVATDQTVPGPLGGSVHVQAVADGLAALGHEVHVATQAGGEWPAGRVTWHRLGPPLGRAQLRWMRKHAVVDLARATKADVIMERYYNFGGEGVFAAKALHLPAVLEVNAPVIDYPGSAKSRIDRALLVEPMRRRRDAIWTRLGRCPLRAAPIGSTASSPAPSARGTVSCISQPRSRVCTRRAITASAAF
jgi:hypothetical protein